MRSLLQGRDKWPLFLYGPAGSGKTLACLCVADYVPTAFYADCSEFVRRYGLLKANGLTSKSGEAISWDRFWREITESSLAILDDIGCREKVNDVHLEAVKTFMDKRKFLPTIYVSNLSVEQIEKVYDDRIASRCSEGTLYFHSEGDMRNEHNF